MSSPPEKPFKIAVEATRVEEADTYEHPLSQTRQRRELGIDEKLYNKPILFVSAHRGAFNAAFEGHLEAFFRPIDYDEPLEDERSWAAELSAVDIDDLMDELAKVSSADDIDNKRLPVDTSSGPRPGFIINIAYLPPLDAQGNSQEGGYSWHLDGQTQSPEDMKGILQKMDSFLRERGGTSGKHPAPLPKQIGQETGSLQPMPEEP